MSKDYAVTASAPIERGLRNSTRFRGVTRLATIGIGETPADVWLR